MTDHKPLTAAQIAEIEARAPYESALLRTWADNDRKRGASIPAEAMERIAEMIDAFPALVRDLRAAREALVRLSNEVLGSVPLMEVAARQAIGNTNYNVLMLRAEEARAALPEETPNG